MVKANNEKQRRIACMNESYIHKNYQRHDDSLFDPNDEQDLETKAQHEGQRFCFITAIVDANYCLPLLLENEKLSCQ